MYNSLNHKKIETLNTIATIAEGAGAELSIYLKREEGQNEGSTDFN